MRSLYFVLALLVVLQTFSFAQPKTGEKAPPFTSATTGGGKISLSSYAGKKAVVLYFWDADFDICKKELQDLNNHFKEYKQQGIQIVSINTNPSSAKKAKAFMTANGLSVPLLMDTDGKISNLYKINGIVPTLFLIDKAGKISYEYQGELSVEKDLNPQIEKVSDNSESETGLLEIPGEKDENGGTHFAIPDTPLEMTFPEGWKMRPAKENTGSDFTRPGKHKERESLFVDVHELPPDPQAIKAFVQDYFKSIHQRLKNVVDVQPPFSISKFPPIVGYEFKFTNKKNVVIHRITVMLVIPGRALVTTASSPESHFESHRKEFTEILKSVKNPKGRGKLRKGLQLTLPPPPPPDDQNPLPPE